MTVDFITAIVATLALAHGGMGAGWYWLARHDGEQTRDYVMAGAFGLMGFVWLGAAAYLAFV